MTGCEPQPTAGRGLPRWLRGQYTVTWAMLVWLPLLLVDPLVHAGDAGPGRWAGLATVAITFTALAAVGGRRFVGPPTSGLGIQLLLAVQALATVAVLAADPASTALLPLLVIAAAILVDGRRGLVAIGAVTVGGTLVVLLAGGTSVQAQSAFVTTLLSGLGCWSFRNLFLVIGELARTREELAELAVTRERERFSRDLHDLLGHTLSVIVVKAQAVRRIAPLDPQAAAGHGADIETIGRRALTEVRQAVDGYRGAGLAAELDRARSALEAAGIACTTSEPSERSLPEGVDALFGWVVREGVTNVIRHSGARTCAIAWSREDDQIEIEIVDDGTRSGPTAAPGGDRAPVGGGLAGLRERVAAAGGRLSAGPAERGFRLVVTVPNVGGAG